jgi:hypothetical protein
VIQNFKIDQTRRFVSLMLIGVIPKLTYGGDTQRQETTKAGLPKWVAQLAAEFRVFDRPMRELINVTIAAEKDPGEGVLPGTFMELIDFEIGIMEKRNRANDEVVGVQVWYRASAMRPINATGTRPRPAPAAAAG